MTPVCEKIWPPLADMILKKLVFTLGCIAVCLNLTSFSDANEFGAVHRRLLGRSVKKRLPQFGYGGFGAAPYNAEGNPSGPPFDFSGSSPPPTATSISTSASVSIGMMYEH